MATLLSSTECAGLHMTADVQADRNSRLSIRQKFAAPICLVAVAFALAMVQQAAGQDTSKAKMLKTEKLPGKGVWKMPILANARGQKLRLVIWFEDQLLGDGDSYVRRQEEWKDLTRTQLRQAAIATLKELNQKSFKKAKPAIDKLVADGTITNVERHWIINGFSCRIGAADLEELANVQGVRKVFLRMRDQVRPPKRPQGKVTFYADGKRPADYDPSQHKSPWYIRQLLVDKVWKDLKVLGSGTRNAIHDFNFEFGKSVTRTLYRNSREVPGNNKDDDGNGYVDDYHGYNFATGSPQLQAARRRGNQVNLQLLHGHSCASIVSGVGHENSNYNFGMAPHSEWVPIVAGGRIENAIEWAAEHEIDTYSMSFSMPGLGNYRSHWRKMMEHGALCGICFVSGAGNFAQNTRIPVQMRTPEDIPHVVFAAAGVQRNLNRTPFSSKGPVDWTLDHYREGRVQKPEVCAFNMGLPFLLPTGAVQETGMNGNSFAGPMFCGAIALVLSANPELKPWEVRAIITSTATDVAKKGFDGETGHGLINCYRAVREALRLKAIRTNQKAPDKEVRTAGDELDVVALRVELSQTRLVVGALVQNGEARKKGIRRGDILVSYNGKPVDNQATLMKLKQAAADKDEVPVGLLRNGNELTVLLKRGPLGLRLVPQFRSPVFK